MAAELVVRLLLAREPEAGTEALALLFMPRVALRFD